VPVVEDLGVALLGLQLEARLPVLCDPKSPGAAAEQWARGRRSAVFAAGEAGAFEQVVGELDAGADAFELRRLRGDEGAVDGLGKRLGRRGRPGVDGEGDRRGRHADHDDQSADQQQARERETTEDVHGSTSMSF
jgi:hypothetical protein